MRAPRYRRLDIAEVTFTRRENSTTVLKMDAVAPHGEASYSPYQRALWQQLQSSDQLNQNQPQHPASILYSSHGLHNQVPQQQEWTRQARAFQRYHVPDQPQLQHEWGQWRFASELFTTHNPYFAPDTYQQEPWASGWRPECNTSNPSDTLRLKSLTQASLDVSMLDESAECDYGEDIVVSHSNPSTPHKHLQTLPIEDSVLFHQSVQFQELSYLASPTLEYLGLRQLSLNSYVAPPAPVSDIAPVADGLDLCEKGLQSWQQSDIGVHSAYFQPPPDASTPLPVNTNTTWRDDPSGREKPASTATKPEAQALAGLRGDIVPMNTNDSEALSEGSITTDPLYSVGLVNRPTHLSSPPFVIGNGISFQELNSRALTSLNKTVEDLLDGDTFHNRYHGLFSSFVITDDSAIRSEPSQWGNDQSTFTPDNTLLDDQSRKLGSNVTGIHDQMFSYNAFGETEGLVFDDFSGVLAALNEALLKGDTITAQQISDRQETAFYPKSKDAFPLGTSPQKPSTASGNTHVTDTTQYASPGDGTIEIPDTPWSHIIDTSLLVVPDMVPCDSSASDCSSAGPCTPHGDPNGDVYSALLETMASQTSPIFVINPDEVPFDPFFSFGSRANGKNQPTNRPDTQPQAVTKRLSKTVDDCLHDSCTVTDHIIETLRSVQPFVDVKNAVAVYVTTRETLTRLYAVTKYKHECYNGCQSWHTSQDKTLRKVRKYINNYCKLLYASNISPGKRIKKTHALQGKLESLMMESGTTSGDTREP